MHAEQNFRSEAEMDGIRGKNEFHKSKPFIANIVIKIIINHTNVKIVTFRPFNIRGLHKSENRCKVD